MCLVVVVVAAFVVVAFFGSIFLPTYFLLQVIISGSLALHVSNVTFNRISVYSPDIICVNLIVIILLS